MSKMKDYKQNIIDERDVFYYVFYPDLLSEDKKEIIKTNTALIESIEFFKELKKNSLGQNNDKVKNLIASKIPAYSFAQKIQLYPIKMEIGSYKEKIRAAADSKEFKPEMTTKSFIDNDKEYLIKVLHYSGITKVFVFSAKTEVVKDFDIIIEPNNVSYHLEDNTQPLKIDSLIEIEKIQLKIN